MGMNRAWRPSFPARTGPAHIDNFRNTVMVMVTLAYLAVRGVHVYPLAKFALAVVVTVPICFALAAGIRRLPLARRIL
jgi:hypothetical protein